jgi:hypothetical protein
MLIGSPTGVLARARSALGSRPARARRVSCQEFQLHARDPACDLDRVVDVRLGPDEAAQLNHAPKRFDIALLRPAVGRLPPRHSGGAGPVGPAGPLPAPTRESPASTTE